MWLLCKGRICLSAGFLLLAAWFAAVNGPKLLAVVLSAAAAHELGHWGMLRLFGAKALALRVGILGAVMEVDRRRLSYGKDMVVTLAGPVVNLLCAMVLVRLGMDTAAGAHLVLGGFNLLPIRPLDGGQALYLLAAFLFGPIAAERLTCWVGAVFAAMLAVFLVWLMVETGGSLWLAPAALGLLGVAGREAFGK